MTSPCLPSTLPPKLYLLTNDDDLKTLLAKLSLVFQTNTIELLQIRRKQTLSTQPHHTYLQEIQKIINLASSYDIKIVINDDIHIAKQFNLGVHLGQSDGKVTDAVTVLDSQTNSDILIGNTCHNDLSLVEAAKNQGAHYAALGAVFASSTKTQAQKVDIETIKAACNMGIDICVIGGLTVENAEALKGIHLQYLAITADIMNQSLSNIEQRCYQWHALCRNWYD